MDPRPCSPPPTAPAFWSGSSTRNGRNLNPAVWQGINGSSIGSSLSPPIARPSCSPRGNDSSIVFPSMSKTSTTDCVGGVLLETADPMTPLNRPEYPDGHSRHGVRLHQDSRRPRTRTLGETLLRGTRSDPNLAGRRHLFEVGNHYTPVATPIPSTLATALPPSPRVSSQRPFIETSKTKPLREAKGVQTDGEKLLPPLNHPQYQERSRSFSRSISNLFRRAYHEPVEKIKTSPRPRRMTCRGTTEESKASRALQQKSQQQQERPKGAAATALGLGVGASPCFTPSVWSFESSEDDGHVNIAARSGTLRLKKLFVWKGNQESISSPDGSLKKQRGHCGLPTSDSPQMPIPPPHALAHSTFDVTMGSGVSSPTMPTSAGPNSLAARAGGGTRRRMNTLLSIMSPTRRSRLTSTVLIEPPNSAPLPLLDPTSHTQDDGEPLTPPSNLPLRVPREIRSKWSDSSAGEEESASTAKASQNVAEAEQATEEAEEVWEPSRRSSDLFAEGWSFSARDASEEEQPVIQCSTEATPPGEATVEPTMRHRDPSDSSVYADQYEETARDAMSTLQRTQEGSDTMEIIGSDDFQTSEHTLVEATTTDAIDLSSDQDDTIHFNVEEEEIPSHPIWHSDSQSEVSSGNHFYDVSFGTTSPSSHGHQQSLHVARQPSDDFRERPLPPLPTMGEMIRPSSSLRDIRGQASTLPLENRTNYLIPRCPCCGGSGRRELSARCPSHCQQLPLLLPTSPRTPTSGNTSCSESGPSTPKSAAFLIALPTVPSPPPKRRASFAIRRSALSCDPHGPLFRYKDLEGGLPGPNRMGRSISTLAIRERAAVTAKTAPAVDSYSMF